MEPRTAARRNPLLGAAVLKATLGLDRSDESEAQGSAQQPGGQQPGGQQAGGQRAVEQRAIFEDLLVALGVTEEQVDAYARENAALVADGVARARGSTRGHSLGATKGPPRG